MKLVKRVLHKKAQPFNWQDPVANQKIAVELANIMLSQKGIGLAAPQCGVSKRLFVMFTDKWRYCFNPELVSYSNETNTITEGCLSFPGEYIELERPSSIEVKYYDYMGNVTSETLEGITARCFLHELDHCDGIVFQDRLNNKVAKKYQYV